VCTKEKISQEKTVGVACIHNSLTLTTPNQTIAPFHASEWCTLQLQEFNPRNIFLFGFLIALPH